MVCVILTILVCGLLCYIPAGRYGPWRRVWLWLTLGASAIAPLWLRNALVLSGVQPQDSWLMQGLLSYPVRVILSNLSAFGFLMCPVECYLIFRKRLTAAAAYTPVAQVVIDGNGIILSWNIEATALLGWTTADAIGHELPDVMIPVDLMVDYHGEQIPAREAHRRGLKRFHATGKAPMLAKKFKTIALHKDGRHIDVEILVNAHTTETGQTFQAQILPIPLIPLFQSLPEH
jgi:PAS domain S-box-containing protein